MSALTPANELRAAAALLRDTARNAVVNGRDRYTTGSTLRTRSPVVVDDPDEPTVLIETFAPHLEQVNAWLVLMSPAIAGPLAALLEATTACGCEDGDDHYAQRQAALALARAINHPTTGEEAQR
ncbi:hypothetical protein ACQEU3_47150 [Spirillospora sp. CA-253888]